MKNWKLVGRIALFFAITAAVITVFLAVLTYFTLSLVSQGAPPEYVAFTILSTIMPYLLVTILSLIVAVMSRAAEAPEEIPETTEEEALPPAEPAEANA